MFRITLFLLSYLSIFSTIVWAETPVFEENFSVDLSQWQLVNGEWQAWQISEHTLYGTLERAHRSSTLVPKDEFWQEMSEYEVDFNFQVFDDGDKNFVIGMRDANNFYDFHFFDQQLIIEDIRNGLSVHFAVLPFPLQKNRVYQFHLLYSFDQLQFWSDEQKIFTTDQTWAAANYGGKFGFKIATGDRAYSRTAFSQLQIKAINSRDVIFKQNDAAWQEITYDHADQWSENASIARWGCALSAVAMILRAHGFFRLENGQEINPATLNQWLRSQPDGYLGDGLLNWLAISRLSFLLSEKSLGLLPKLEFKWLNLAEPVDFEQLATLLIGNPSQIASDGQHFFVLERYLDDEDDFLIKDPLYDQQRLSQKTEALHSLRLFTPSQTDLSYILLLLPKELKPLLNHSELGIMESLEVSEKIVSEREVLGQAWQLIYYPKPAEGNLTLTLSSKELTQELLEKSQIYLYQSNGQVQQVALIDYLSANLDYPNLASVNLQINYLKNDSSPIELSYVDQTLEEQKLSQLDKQAQLASEKFKQGQISFYLFYQLNLLINSLREHLDYFFLLEKFLRFHGL